MIGLGQSRRFRDVNVTSVLPLIADLRRNDRQVRTPPDETSGLRSSQEVRRLAVEIDPSGQLLDSFFDLNNLALSRFSPEERNWYGTGVDIEDRKRAESLIAVEKQDGG
jgi:hypothetical protein